MRRGKALACALVLLAGLTACGGEGDSTAGTGAGDTAPQPAQEAPSAEGAADGVADSAPADDSASAPAPAEDRALTTSPLLDPTHPDANHRAPDEYRVRFETSKGDFVVEVHRDWAPRAADRFYNLVRIGYFDGNRFFRVVDGFVAQFGMHGDPAINEAWDGATIPDDPPNQMNTRGRITFAHGGPETRTTQLFINLRDNLNLDNQGFPPFGEVVDGMAVVDSLYSGYGDGPPYGSGPDQMAIGRDGNRYLEREYPLLDYVERATVIAER